MYTKPCKDCVSKSFRSVCKAAAIRSNKLEGDRLENIRKGRKENWNREVIMLTVCILERTIIVVELNERLERSV